ncbi:acetate--CoA ligase family protein [Mesorhizobium sp. VK25A]|uniref:Acetate--CoA ligase family protein n=1 Tax=Mesorhizobium vachelliae TaxID=3072309 RepID=A0ABU5AF40_9HYPH|nr:MULTISPECIES: acetate--CoA ligase family protein [unclassified Mesorhizobium]MDX8535890.1 acetate--CoA ligase family protein [Mesorhizobium sp. VK25D]MDX8548644.1 acetate--CoA ligase family protein [Mesorhizobium sp. VK25A]
MNTALNRILCARSLAIIGASSDPAKRGYQAIRQLLSDGFAGRIFPINPKSREILGLKCYPSVLDVGETIDAALICTPAKMSPGILDQCGQKGITGVIVLAAGFAEIGPEGAKLADECLAVAQRNNVRIIGPNTNGVFNLHNRMNLVGVQGVEPGGIGIVSQSGNMSLALITEAKRRGGLGFSTYVGVGNQLDVRFNEYLEYFGQDQETKAAVFYVEGFKNGRKFLDVCREVAKKKPVIIYKSGRTAAGQNAASSHTGALAGSFALTRDLLRQAGATVIEQSDKILSVAEGLSKLPVASGDRVAILSDGGGHGTITTDTLIEHGLTLAELSDETRMRLAGMLPASASLTNPVDVAGGTDENPACFADCAQILLEDPGVDILMIIGIFGGYAMRFSESLLEMEIETSRRVADLARRYGKPLVVQSVYGTLRPKPLEYLKELGIPLFIWPENAVRCVAELVRYSGARRRIARAQPLIPGPAKKAAQSIISGARSEGRDSLYEHEAKTLLATYGVTVPPHLVVREAGELVHVTAKLGDDPMAMKIVSQDILHKSEAGGVKLEISGGKALCSSFEAILENAHAFNPRARIHGVLVSPMARPGVEVIVGVVHDPIFGPVIMFGLGGIFVEVLKDVSFRALPICDEDAQEMIEEIQSKAILNGVRGAAPVDKSALVDLIMKVAMVSQLHPEIAEIDLNPIIARDDGYDVVDARMIFSNDGD